MSSRTPKEKLLIHMCYLLTERFTKVHDSIFRLLKAFIQHLSIREDGKVLSDFLLVLSEIKVKHYFFDPWTDCIGAFLMTMGCDAFFKTLPLDPVGHDMNSLTYAQDSKSFLMPILKRHLKKGDLEFFVNYFIPIIKDLEAKIKEYAVQNIHGNALKAQKYKVIVIQIWELLPAFCRYNSPKLTDRKSVV